MIRVAQRVPSLDRFHTHAGKNVARLCAFNLVAIVGVHFHHSTHSLGFTGSGVKNGVALLDFARVNTDEGERTKAVIHNFECQGTERLVNRHKGLLASGVTFLVSKILRINLLRSGQIIDNSVEYQLYALIFEC